MSSYSAQLLKYLGQINIMKKGIEITKLLKEMNKTAFS